LSVFFCKEILKNPINFERFDIFCEHHLKETRVLNDRTIKCSTCRVKFNKLIVFLRFSKYQRKEGTFRLIVLGSNSLKRHIIIIDDLKGFINFECYSWFQTAPDNQKIIDCPRVVLKKLILSSLFLKLYLGLLNWNFLLLFLCNKV
jgi:hypothetical protein